MNTTSPLFPTLYAPHGAGPWPFMTLPSAFGTPESWHRLSTWMRGLAAEVGATPRAIVVVSAHWDSPLRPTLATAARPGMLFDYHGFPDGTYRLSYPAPGAPELATRVRELLAIAGIDSDVDGQRGFDHGVFVPLMLMYPQADIPVLPLSLQRDLDPEAHLAIGRALAPLRAEGVLIVGSGMSYHNMDAFRKPTAENRINAHAFDHWLTTAVEHNDPAERTRLLSDWRNAPGGLDSHRPGHEHLTPLFVVAGAAREDAGRRTFSGDLIGLPSSGFHFG